MVINLVPEFLAAVEALDRVEAYCRYLTNHLPVLEAYWHNYILDLDSPHAQAVIERVVTADRRDLHALFDAVDVVACAEETIRRCEECFEVDRPFDVYLMVGVGGANAGELVVGGRGIAFVCLEHFTGRPNHETLGLGLQPALLAPWIAHEVAHTVRYTSPDSRSELARIVRELGGYYDYWESGSRATLQELLVSEGLAVAAAQIVAPQLEPWEYLGYTRRQYRRLRQLEAFLTRAVEPELGRSGLGYRLRYLMGGASAAQRLVAGKVIPERAGYYLGLRMVEPMVAQVGIGRALRAAPEAYREFAQPPSEIQTA